MGKRKLSAGLAAYNARRKAGKTGKKARKQTQGPRPAKRARARKKGKRALSPGLLAYMAAKRANATPTPKRKALKRRSPSTFPKTTRPNNARIFY